MPKYWCSFSFKSARWYSVYEAIRLRHEAICLFPALFVAEDEADFALLLEEGFFISCRFRKQQPHRHRRVPSSNCARVSSESSQNAY
jgi:hypothetical protein